MPGRLLDSLAARSVSSNTGMDHLKRPSLSGLAQQLKPHHASERRHQSKERIGTIAHKSSSPAPAVTRATVNTMSLTVESPPNVFYGTPTQSTGALFSGQLRIKVVDAELTLTKFTMEFLASIAAMKPVSKDCSDCAVKVTQLFRWTFLTEPKTLKMGEHSFPFSYLIPGHLPTTTDGQLGKLQYLLKALAKTSAGDVTLNQVLPVSRALPPMPEKSSVRIFPPTNLTAHLQFSPIIHPIGETTSFLRITGITTQAPHDPNIQLRWRLRKMSWRLEETEKMVSPACSKHAHKVGGEGRGIMHEDVRVLGHGEMKEGWKTDLQDDHIEMEFTCGPNGSTRPLCDVESPTGLSVTHAIVIELVIAEEWAFKKMPHRSTPTGAARVLRASFQLAVTERSGMGISWDEEQPPTYDDVPASPPTYINEHDALAPAYVEGEIHDLSAMEELSLNELRRPSPHRVNSGSSDGRGRSRTDHALLRDIMEEGRDDEYNRPATRPPSRSQSPATGRVD